MGEKEKEVRKNGEEKMELTRYTENEQEKRKGDFDAKEREEIIQFTRYNEDE